LATTTVLIWCGYHISNIDIVSLPPLQDSRGKIKEGNEMAKVPNPYEKTTASYFDNTEDGGIRCIGAALSMAHDVHVIVCATDAVALRKAWGNLSSEPLDMKRTQILLYKYGTELEQLGRDQLEDFKEELASNKTKVSELKKDTSAKPWSWFYYKHSKNAECFIEEDTYEVDRTETRLGKAEKCSEAECIELLRQNKIPRSEIANLKINPSVDGLIPF
jgi:hypothetical protein